MIDALLEPKQEKYITCDMCGAEIYEGDEYWEFFTGEILCERCKDDYVSEFHHYYDPDDTDN